MAKFGNFVAQSDIKISKEEVLKFKEKFDKLLKPYFEEYDFDCSVKECELMGNTTLYFKYTPKKLTSWIRNIRKDRVSFDGLSFAVNKSVGYLDNFDWCNMKPKDPTKAERNYEDAPEFQWGVRLIPEGAQIEYRHRTRTSIYVRDSFEWGTEFDDIDFRDGVRELFKIILRKK